MFGLRVNFRAKLIKQSEEKIKHEPSQSYIEDLIINTFDEYTLENISVIIYYNT
jgi:type III secretory pathway lipoprotein EscJ